MANWILTLYKHKNLIFQFLFNEFKMIISRLLYVLNQGQVYFDTSKGSKNIFFEWSTCWDYYGHKSWFWEHIEFELNSPFLLIICFSHHLHSKSITTIQYLKLFKYICNFVNMLWSTSFYTIYLLLRKYWRIFPNVLFSNLNDTEGSSYDDLES